MSSPGRPEGEQARLSELQRPLWLAHRLEPEAIAYHVVSAWRVVEGRVDGPRLAQAFDRLVERHRILHSRWLARDGFVEQLFDGPSPQLSCRAVDDPARLQESAEFFAREPFDLELGPPIRLALFEGAEQLLVLCAHHLVADERALLTLWRDLATAYESPGDPAPGDDPPQFDDLEFTERTGQSGRERRAAALRAWRQRAGEVPAEPLTLDLPPIDGPGRAPAGPVADAPRSWIERPLEAELLVAAERAASAAGQTPFALFAFVFRLLLDRWSCAEGDDPTGDRQQVVFGTPVSVRTAASADAVGYFLNAVPVLSRVRPEAGVAEEFARFARRLRAELANAAPSTEEIAAALQVERTTGGPPLFQTFFVHRRGTPPPQLGDAALRAVELDLGAPKFHLTLFVDAPADAGDAGRVALECEVSRFPDELLQRLLDQYRHLLAQVVALLDDAAAEQRVDQLQVLLPEEERELALWERGPELGDSERELRSVVLEMLEQVRSRPASSAVRAPDGGLSYAELGARAAQVAAAISHGLEEDGASSTALVGRRIGILLDRSTDLVAGVLGALWTGAAYVPLDPEDPPQRLERVLADAEVDLLLTSSAVAERHADLLNVPSSSSQQPTVLCVDELGPAGALDAAELDDLAAHHRSLPGERPAYLLYTSGSTGRPKGVVVTHDALAASTAARRQWYAELSRTTPERFGLLSSIAFDSSVAGFYWALTGGGTLVVPSAEEARDARRLATWVEREQVSDLLCVPSLWQQVVRFGAEHLGSLRCAVVAGESCPPDLVRLHHDRLGACELVNEYGPTEGTVWATAERLGVDSVDAPGGVGIGRPIPGAEVRVADPAGRRVPRGAPGELWIAGPTLSPGYWRQDEETGRRFVELAAGAGSPGGRRAYRTGDRVRWSEDGRLLFLGRVDTQVKVRGVRIELGEVEAVLQQLEDVEQVAATAIERRGVVAFVVTRQPSPDLTAWRPVLEQRLPSAAVPRSLIPVDRLPTLPNGKLDRRSLRRRAREELTARAATEVSPTDGVGLRVAGTPVEHALLQLWRALLPVPQRVDFDANWFDLGGHSLLVVELCEAVERELGVRLEPAEIFAHPTVRQLAGHVASSASGGAASCPRHLFAIQPSGDAAPYLMCIPHEFTPVLAEAFHGRRPVYGLRGVGLRAEGNRGRWPTLQALARELADEVEQRFADQQAFHVGGYSFGGSMAVELARELERRGRRVLGLEMIAPMALDLWRAGPLTLQIGGPFDDGAPADLGASALVRWLAQNHPLQRRPWQTLRHRLWTTPRRVLLARRGQQRVRDGGALTAEMMHADVRLERFRLHRGYRPQPLDVPTRIFTPAPDRDAAATWRPIFRRAYEAVVTADPHDGEQQLRQAMESLGEHWRQLEDGSAGECASQNDGAAS